MAKRGGKAADVPLSRFGVLVAQLESIVSSAPQQPPDALLCFDLLSELVSAIEEEPKEAIAHWQRKCEDALHSLLVLGARRPVRHLASVAMVRVIARGDNISIYSRVSSLQGWLAEGKRSEPLSCAGAAQCLGELYRIFGRRITSGLTETTSIASKLMKFHEDFVRQDALLMLQNALEGSCGSGSPAAFSEAFRVIMRVAGSDRAYNVRIAAARCLKTFANIKGPGLGIAELESAASYCIKALEDPVLSVRDAFGEALGAVLALGMNLEEQMKQKVKNNTGPPKKLEGGLQKHLIVPFMRASGVRAKDVRIGLTLSWVFFLQMIHLKYHIPDSELQDFALQAMSMLHSDPSVDAHALACVLYILRVGVTDQMMEPTQRKFLVLLGRQLESSDLSPSVGVAVLRMLSYLLTTLGQVPLEFREILDNTVVAALSHSSTHVRVEASLTLRTLAEVDPTCVGGLISYGVTTLSALRDSASIEKGQHLKLELDSLHGQATALAAVVSISPRLLLGYPARLPKSVFEVSKKMLMEVSQNPVAATVEKEAGWLLLASLIMSMPKMELEDQVFDILLLWAGPFAGNIESHIDKMQDVSSEIRVLSTALEALTAFIKSFLSPVTTNGGILLQPVLVYLSRALSYIRSLRTRQVQSIKPSVDMFTLRALMAYQSLLDPLAYKSEHHQIIEICSTPFSDPTGCEESSSLRLLLDKRDAYLGPWTPGRDWLEDELRAFGGGKDGVLPCLWEDQVSCFPQPESVSKMLVNEMLLSLGSIFATQDSEGKMRLLTMIDQCLKTGKKHSWHAASVTNACVVLLMGIKAVLALRVPVLENETLSSMQSIFLSILTEGEICPAQRRASSEGLGLLARLGNDSFTARMARSLLGELATATDPGYLGSLGLALGCIHCSAGGMAFSTLVPATVSSISSLARSSNTGTRLWSLHALLLTIEAAGLSYVSQVQATLTLAIDILLAEENGSVDLRQGIGRLINAIVAVIGPELAPGSTFFSRCKSVVAETSSGRETSTLLESVRFTQQLVLFAPQAVSVHSHVQTLLPTLTSRQPTLRHLAVSTLQHLIEKDPVTIMEERIEENLFRMLDEETDSEIGNLVRMTINRLLYTSCPSCPSRWLALCHSMVLATSKRNNTAEEHAGAIANTSNGNSFSEGDARLYYGEDDENMIASSTGPQMQDPVSVANMHSRGDKHLRYRTRVFAAECLSCVPQAVGTDPAHFDLSLARRLVSKGRTLSNDWLVLHLQELVSLAYQISTSQFEGMQPIGVKLLITIMDKFGKTQDPELPGHHLVEQYQAQFISAIRSAISISSGPSLLEASLQLATKMLTSSMMGGDRVALQRMFALISRPLHDFDDLYYPSFAEWVACKIKIRLLSAHASIKCYVYALLRERKSLPDEYVQLIPLFSDTSSKLGKYWNCILRDYFYISFGMQSKLNDKSFLDGIQSLLVSSRVKSCLDEAWPLILQALALDAVPMKFELDNSTHHTVDDSDKQVLSSRYVMVKLGQREFDFLWGLALLILFQAQKPVIGLGETPLLCNSRMKSCAEQMHEDTQGSRLFEIALITLQSLSTDKFLNAEFLSMDLLKELLQVLMQSDQVTESWDRFAIPLFSKILQSCPDVFFDAEDFISLAMELCMKYLYRTCLSYDKCSVVENLISATLNAAERLVCQTNYQKHWKVKLAFWSATYKCLVRTSSDLFLSKLIAFLQEIAPLFRKFFEDDAIYDDACRIVEFRATMVSDLCEYCLKKLHMSEKQTNDQWKLLAKKLTFFMEDAISIARVAHEMWTSGKRENTKSIFSSLYKHCIKCVRMALTDVNVKVQAIGLLVLKAIAQKEHSEGLDVKIHHFYLFFTGELLEDIFFLIQDTLKKPASRESIVVCEECLRFLLLFHTLSQGNEQSELLTKLLLEGIFLVFSASPEFNLQEVNEIKTIALRLISHLVQVPSTAAQIKEILLSMPTSRRQLLQDIIRSSVSQGQTGSQMKFSNPSPIINFPLQSDVGITQSQQLPSDSTPLNPRGEDHKEEIVSGARSDDDVDSDDDWDTFQSFPAADTATYSTQIETDKALVQSSESDHQSSGSTPTTLYHKVNHGESLHGVEDYGNMSIENKMQDPLYPRTYVDDENVPEVEYVKNKLADISDPQLAHFAKDFENDQKAEDEGRE